MRFGKADEYAALTAAVWYDSPIVSFPTISPWNNSPVHVSVNEINEAAIVTTYETSIHNLYSSRVLERLESNLLSKRNESIKSTKEILYRKDELYPFIEFCGKAPEQLLNTFFNQSILGQIKESISALNLFCEKWKNGEYANYSHANLTSIGLNHKVNGESPTVLQNSKLRKEREFYLPNGYKVFFENHIKIANGYRIHFYPDSNNRKIFIGYIGTHLRLN